MTDPRLLWRVANASTLKVLRGEFRGQYHINLGRTEAITSFFAGLPQIVDHRGLRVDLWTEPASGPRGEDAIPPWRLAIRRMAAESARPMEWYISSQQPGATHPVWRPDTGPTAATEPDTDYIVLLREGGDRFFAGWLDAGRLADLPAALRAEVEGSNTGTMELTLDLAEAILDVLGQSTDLSPPPSVTAEPGDDEDREPAPAAEEQTVAHEGQPIKSQHVRRERSRRLRRARIDAARERLTCEACGFDFERVYGDRGRGFIECHHLIPISELDPAMPTRFEDLALLCANCHRMVHVRQPWLTVGELRQLLATAPAG